MKFARRLWIILCTIALVGLFPGNAHFTVEAQGPELNQKVYLPLVSKAATTVCRFGISAIPGNSGYDINFSALRVGGFIDGNAEAGRTFAQGVDYLHVIPVGGATFDDTARAAAASTLAAANPKGYWQIGNKPDAAFQDPTGKYTDNLTAEEYAHRYYVIATAIKQADPTAKIGFGAIMQPTPIRLRYMERARMALVLEAGGNFPVADSLIDFWSINVYILNEIPGQWGIGVPKGFENDHADAIEITDFTDTYSIDKFTLWVRTMRNWMRDRSQKDKALWITEYGSLFPPVDPPGGPDYANVSDEDTASYMLQTFDYLNSATNLNTGMPLDNYRLVQRWFWYSLNGHRYFFGGTVYDPDNANALTLVGQEFIDYMNPLPLEGTCLP
jgi:hypothetical protein